MKILLIGSGGREHALAWKIAQSPKVDKLYIAPGNAGTSACGENVAIGAGEFDRLKDFAAANGVDMIVVGPEDPLVKGIYDDFKADPTGLWKKTDQSTYISIETSEFKYYAHDYLIFETRNNGIFEVHVVGEDRVYNARFNVRWGTDEAFLDIIPPIKSPDAPDGIVTQRIRVFKDSDGQVGYQVVAPDEGHASNIRLLRKDDRVNKNKRPI